MENRENEPQALAHTENAFNTIRVIPSPIPLDGLVRRIERGLVNLSPPFQRKIDLWTDGAQSRLIESLLLQIPIPAFYLDATNEQDWIVIDGVQRLTAFARFVIDEQTLKKRLGSDIIKLKLCELEFLTDLNGKTYDDLNFFQQERIQLAQMTVYTIAPGAPDKLKYHIFKRINTGGLSLYPQEIRNALYPEVTEFLYKLATSSEFLNATNERVEDERREDQEYVLRFIAFTQTPYTEYEDQDFDQFLRDAMGKLSQMEEKQRNELEQTFKDAMAAAHEIFGDVAFCKVEDGVYSGEIDPALFEMWCVHLGQLSETDRSNLVTKNEYVAHKFLHLRCHFDLRAVRSPRPETPDRLKRRFETVEKFIKEMLDTPDPWENIEAKYPIGEIVTGTVVKVDLTGAEIELEKDVQGLILTSELWGITRYATPREILSEGDAVDVVVLRIDRERRRILIGHKQSIQRKYKVNSTVQGTIVRFTDFGAFVELEKGVQGLIHKTELSWTKARPVPSEILSEGEVVNVVVIEIDLKKQHLALSYKRAKYNIGSVVQGKIVKINKDNAVVELEDGIKGLIRSSELAPRRVEDVVSVDDELDLKVIDRDVKRRHIYLSLKDEHNKQHRRQRHPPRNKSDDRPTLLGGLLREELNRTASKKVNESPPTKQKSKGGT